MESKVKKGRQKVGSGAKKKNGRGKYEVNEGRRKAMKDREIRTGREGIVVCQHLMLSRRDRSAAGLNAALPALGACGVTAAHRQGR